MICGSCRRRTDPNRSFCTNCGSSVFIDEEPSLFTSSRSRSSSSPPPSRSVSLSSSALSPERVQAAQQRLAAVRARAAKASAKTAAASAPAFRIGGLVRFIIFVVIVWNVAGWLLRIPEVVALKDGFLSGVVSDAEVTAARDAVVARVDNLLGRAPAPPSEPARPAAPAPASRPTPAARTQPAAATSSTERIDARITTPPDTVRVPPGVSLPGDDILMPRVLRAVKPTYTPDALRARIQGSVLLDVVVRTHGAATDITVARSLDDRFGLDQQAIDAVRQWRFAPGERRGHPVPVLVEIEVPFVIR